MGTAALRGQGLLQHASPQFWGQQLVGVEKFYVLYITETCKIWALAVAEQQQKYIQTY